MKYLLGSALLFLGVTLVDAQCNYTASSATQSAVNTVLAEASAGQTVCLPLSAGSQTWGTNTDTDATTTIPAGVTLNLEGWVLSDDLYKGGSECSGGVPMFTMSTSNGNVTRLTNGTIDSISISANCGESEEHIQVTGTDVGYFRIDHLTWNGSVASGGYQDMTFVNGSDAIGVADHNTLNDYGDTFAFAIHNLEWLGTGYYGDNSWAQSDTFGSESAFYMENNTFANYPSSAFPVGCFDAEEGGRLVFRFNTGCPFVGTHGLDSSGRYRSVRAWEVYDNSFTASPNPNDNMYTGIFMRGGTGYVFSNIFTDTGLSTPYITLIQLNSYRDTAGYAPWGYGGTSSVAGSAEGCDGRGGFDTNSGSNPYVTFTASGSSTTDSTVASSSPGWTTNEWTNGFSGNPTYSLVDTTAGWGSTIASNTSDTIVTNPEAQDAGNPHLASSGDAMEIMAAYPCLDQIGRGAGIYIHDASDTDGIPVLSSTGNPGADNQASDPAYDWLNSLDGTTQSPAFTVGGTGYYHIQANRDYYGYASSFTGATGTGSGTLANRPSTCTKGVAYWDTSEGTWDNGQSNSGELDICTATNTWTNGSYVPYTYPHPLVGTATTTPSAPQLMLIVN